MSLLQRYLSIAILQTTGLVLLALLGLEIFILMISQLNSIGSGDYNLWQAFMYVLLNLPTQIYSFFPMAGLLGVLLALGLLAGHSELIVMRAAGISLARITFMVMKVILFLVLLVSLMGETLAPIAARFAVHQKQIAVTKGQALTTAEGIWIRDGHDFIHIDQVISEKRLLGISRYQFDNDRNLQYASYAELAEYQKPDWHMTNVQQTRFLKNNTQSKVFAEQEWHFGIDPAILRDVELEPNAMTLLQLYKTMQYHRKVGIHQGSYESAFWQRVLQPLSTSVMMFLAIPFIFGPLRGTNMSIKLLMGIGAGFSFYILNQFFSPLSVVLQWPPFVSSLLPTFLFAVLGFVLLQRAR